MTSKTIAQFISDQEAATSVEYAIMLGLVILGCIAGIQAFGAEATNTMTSNSQEIAGAINP